MLCSLLLCVTVGVRLGDGVGGEVTGLSSQLSAGQAVLQCLGFICDPYWLLVSGRAWHSAGPAGVGVASSIF